VGTPGGGIVAAGGAVEVAGAVMDGAGVIAAPVPDPLPDGITPGAVPIGGAVGCAPGVLIAPGGAALIAPGGGAPGGASLPPRGDVSHSQPASPKASARASRAGERESTEVRFRGMVRPKRSLYRVENLWQGW